MILATFVGLAMLAGPPDDEASDDEESDDVAGRDYHGDLAAPDGEPRPMGAPRTRDYDGPEAAPWSWDQDYTPSAPRLEMTHGFVGIQLGIGGRLDGGHDPKSTQSRIDEARVMASLRLRFFGLAEMRSRNERVVWFIAPDLDAGLLFGGRLGGRGFFGANLSARSHFGLASPGRVAAYLKGTLGVYGHAAGTAEGAYAGAPLGGGAGLRLATELAVLHVGPYIDGTLGVHDLGGPFAVFQTGGGGDLMLHATSERAGYLGASAAVDTTLYGRWGGDRLNGRVTLDMMLWGRRLKLPLLISLTYRGIRVTEGGSRQFTEPGRIHEHHLVLLSLGGGVGGR